MSIIKKLLPHLCVVLAGVLLTFVIIDRFNANRGLADNDLTKGVLFVFCIVALIVSGMLIYKQRRED